MREEEGTLRDGRLIQESSALLVRMLTTLLLPSLPSWKDGRMGKHPGRIYLVPPAPSNGLPNEISIWTVMESKKKKYK